MIDLDWFRTASAVRVGNLWLPPKQGEASVARHCKQLFFLTNLDSFPYRFPGSATAIKVDDKYFILFCGHQLDGINPDRIAIHTFANNTITAAAYISPNLSDWTNDTDILDVTALQFYPEEYGSDRIESMYFPVNRGRLAKQHIEQICCLWL